MRIVFAIPVRYVEELHDGTYVASGIESNAVQFESYPAVAHVKLLVQIAASPGESGPEVNHVLDIRLVGPDLLEIQEPMSMGFTILPSADSPPGWESRLTIGFDVGLEVDSPGGYAITLAADGCTPYDVPIICR